MTGEMRRQRELLLIDILQNGLDLHALALEAESQVLVYLAELLAKRARDELGATARPCEDEIAAAHPMN